MSVAVWLTPNGEPSYSIVHPGSTVLKQSRLGIIRSDGDFSSNLLLDSVSGVQSVTDKYTVLQGKRLTCSYSGNKRVFFFRNAVSQEMEIIFQVSNDGVAFRYFFPGRPDTTLTIFKEKTSFHVDLSTKAFLQPCDDARIGWCYASPSYENYYQMEIPVGTVAPNQAGWIMPALFHFDKFWVSITETALDTNYCGSRLSQFSPDGEHSPRTITLDVPSISTATTGVLIGDSDTGRDFVERKVDISKPIQLILQAYGGFVMKTMSP